MKIDKPGFYRTRDGRKVEIAAINPNAAEYSRCIGWINGLVFTCSTEGLVLSYKDHGGGIVSEWADPVQWDWNTIPPWLNYLAMDDDLEWMLYADKPERTPTGWRTDGPYCDVPPAFWPKWSSDWKQSLTMRPGYKEAK